MSLIQGDERVGTVTDEEKREVLSLYERIIGLKELLPILKSEENAGNNGTCLYDRAVNDLGSTTRKQQEWWQHMANKYKWKGRDGGSWKINFENNDIYLQYTVV